jgi:hypothetical protein
MPNLLSTLTAIAVALQMGREYFVRYTFENSPELLRYAALLDRGPDSLNLFRGNGNDAQRSAIMTLMVKDSEILAFMKSSKKQIVRYTCWKCHEELFAKVVNHLSISSEDVCAEGGITLIYSSFFISSVYIVLLLLADYPSALWIACNVGSIKIVRQLLLIMANNKSDDPGPDGTTSFSIALGRGYKDIVKLFIDLDIGQSLSLYLESGKSSKITSIQNDRTIKNP